MRSSNASRSIFGAWSMATALLADAVNPLPEDRQQVIGVRLYDCLDDIQKAPAPSRESWRDLADAMNLLQSLRELGWIADGDQVIEAAKAALLEAHEHYLRHGKLRMSGPNLTSVRELIEQVLQLLAQISARAYWSAVRVTEKRVTEIHRGKVRAGDTVVQL